MDKQDTFNKFCEAQLKEFTQVLEQAAKEAITKVSDNYLPYISEDTECNVEHRTTEVIKKLLNGEFTVDSDGYLTVEQPHTFIRIAVTNYRWDKFRTELVKLMPKCPKDAEIEMLRETLRIERDRGRGW